ncbi:MAG: phosphoribosylamine--glycine ligase [Parvibaculales bacterium]
MDILVLGGGGREHALCWKIAQSPLLGKLYCAPGNGGINTLAEPVALNAENPDDVVAFATDNNISLVVVGPEAPLVAGVADALNATGIAVFGPSAFAAQLEGSKGFTKDICAAYDIPTAAYARFDNAADAHAYLDDHPAPIVVKADGLAAGKGVIIAETDAQAHEAVDMIFDGGFGAAGAELVIEAFLTGEEASFFVLCDGTRAIPLATAQDHKRVGDGDTGPNTGGMGAYSPASIMTPALIEETLDRIIEPTLKAMSDKGHPYRGVLYAGLMLTEDGPQLIEYNARFGDPECQVLMLRMESDIVPALMSAAKGDLSDVGLDWSDDVAMTVVMAAKGYPRSYEKNTLIEGLDAAEQNGAVVFHAGTKAEAGDILATGGRVLNVTARGGSVTQARQNAYAAIDKINWPGGFNRTDIGWREVAREKKT